MKANSLITLKNISSIMTVSAHSFLFSNCIFAPSCGVFMTDKCLERKMCATLLITMAPQKTGENVALWKKGCKRL